MVSSTRIKNTARKIKRKVNINAGTIPRKMNDWKVTQAPTITKAQETPPRKLKSASNVLRFMEKFLVIVVEKYRTAEVNVGEHHEDKRLQERHERKQSERNHRKKPWSEHEQYHQEHIVPFNVTEQPEAE